MDPFILLLFGSSMLLSILAASLAECANLHVAHVTTWPEACHLLAEDFPDVLIFDLTDTSQGLVLPLLLTNPGLLLIGVDPSSDDLLVLSSRPQHVTSVQDLIAVIGKAAGATAATSCDENIQRSPLPDSCPSPAARREGGATD